MKPLHDDLYGLKRKIKDRKRKNRYFQCIMKAFEMQTGKKI
jgi:hypothetical protein